MPLLYRIRKGMITDMKQKFHLQTDPGKTSKIPRIEFIDELRGISIFCMVIYHAFYFFSSVMGYNFAGKAFDFFLPAQPIFASIFIITSGVCSRFSRSNAKRGLRLAVISLIITLVTGIILPFIGIDGQGIYFGILHFFAVAMLIFAASKKLLDKIKPETGVAVSFLFFLLTSNVDAGYIGLFNIKFFSLPKSWYEPEWLFPLGFFNESFSSADYFPLLPYLFLFISGTYLGVVIKNSVLPEWCYKKHVSFLSYLGRHSLIIYVFHMVVIFSICMLLKMITEWIQ